MPNSGCGRLARVRRVTARAAARFARSALFAGNVRLAGNGARTARTNRRATSPATLGSPHPYDSNVPILMYGPRWVAPGRIDSAVEVIDLAPMLAQLLGVAAPPAAEGKPLPLRAGAGR
jgi:hypothetical protein